MKQLNVESFSNISSCVEKSKENLERTQWKIQMYPTDGEATKEESKAVKE